MKEKDYMPNEWAKIDTDSVVKTIEYLNRYCGHTDKDVKTRWSFLIKRANQSFGGGCGGICGYKEYKRLLKYVESKTKNMKYGEVAAAICFIRMWNSFEKSIKSSVDLQMQILNYQKRWYTHQPIADGEYMWRVYGNYEGLLCKLMHAYKELNGDPQICNVFRVLEAMQFNQGRMNAIQRYLDNDEL